MKTVLLTIVILSILWISELQGQQTFYAYHTKLVHSSTDYFGKYADLIVVLGNGNRLEFTRRTQYLPKWVTSKGSFMVDDFFQVEIPIMNLIITMCDF